MQKAYSNYHCKLNISKILAVLIALMNITIDGRALGGGVWCRDD